MKRCSQTLKSLPRRMSKKDNFSFVGVNAMLKTNMHIRKEMKKTNSTRITGPGHSSSSVSYGMNGLKQNDRSGSCWSLLTWALTSWRWWVITFIISIICAICKLWPASRLRGPGDRRVGGSERPLPGTASAASAGCGSTMSKLHGAMGSNKIGPVFGLVLPAASRFLWRRRLPKLQCL